MTPDYVSYFQCHEKKTILPLFAQVTLEYIKELICELAMMIGSDKKIRNIYCVNSLIKMGKLMAPE